LVAVEQVRGVVGDDVLLGRDLAEAVAVVPGRAVFVAERDAEEQLEVVGNVQNIADGVGVEAQHGLRDSAQAPSGQGGQEGLGVHADVAAHAHAVTEDGSEEHGHVGAP
jgi:formylmethanofuran:tetrahydromethanopterin formyltransferase